MLLPRFKVARALHAFETRQFIMKLQFNKAVLFSLVVLSGFSAAAGTCKDTPSR
jgi:hypothetical protein